VWVIDVTRQLMPGVARQARLMSGDNMDTSIHARAIDYGQEIQRHVADLQAFVRQLRSWQPSRGVVLVLVLIAFIGGTIFGATQNNWWKSREDSQVAAAIRMVEAREEARGDRSLTERFRAQAMDKAVVSFVNDQSASVFSRANFYRIVMRLLGTRSLSLEQERSMVTAAAEVRLKSISAVSEATIAELQQRGLDGKLQGEEVRYSPVASSYSSVLGRKVAPRELITNSNMQLQISYHDEMRALALKNAASGN
jgi:hypothetical protein